MYETLGLEMTPREASVWLGLAVGLGFGLLAQLTRFCLRRALVGPEAERAEARGRLGDGAAGGRAGHAGGGGPRAGLLRRAPVSCRGAAGAWRWSRVA